MDKMHKAFSDVLDDFLGALNGMRRVTIHVTAEDISHGIKRNALACPLFYAVERVLPNLIYIGCGTAVLTDERTLMLPYAARRFLRGFDAGEPVEPFEFELEIPA